MNVVAFTRSGAAGVPVRFICSLSLGAAIVSISAVSAAPQSNRAPRPAGTMITVRAVPVPLNPDNRSQSAVGPFVYAGGLVLTSSQTDRLHGLSDLEITGSDRFTAVGDEGVFVTGRIGLDKAGRLADVRDTRLQLLTGEDGQPLGSKEEADSEGLALFPNGDRLVSFERDHRIWLYPANGSAPRPVPKPDVTFPVANGGMEALAADPDAGPDAYVVGAELTGETWTCRISTACTKGPTVPRPEGMSLVALKRLAGGRTVYLLRAFAPATGNRVALVIMRRNAIEAQLDLARPLTIDNFEGVAAVSRPGDVIRFYLISDDNASPTQRTILLAFDWRPTR